MKLSERMKPIMIKALFCFVVACSLASCCIQTKEVFTINPDLSGKCLIEARMFVDTSYVDARLAAKDTLYGISPCVPDFHKMRFSRKDAMKFALRIIKTKGIEIWNNIHFGLSKKKDMIIFTGVAYFRDITRVHFSMLDSAIKVSKGANGEITLSLDPTSKLPIVKVADSTLDRQATQLKQQAFYIRPVLADQLNSTEATVIYNLPGKITSSSVFGQQGDDVVQLTLTGNEVLRYADSVAKNHKLAMEYFKYASGPMKGIMEPLFNRIVWQTDEPVKVTFTKGKSDLFNYNQEVQHAMVFFDNFMERSKLERLDSTMMMKEEKADEKRPEEYGKLVINKADSTAKKPYFTDMVAILSHDTITLSGELSEGIKVEPKAKIHIQKIIEGTEHDITDSIVARNKIEAQLISDDGKDGEKVPKRKIRAMFLVHFPVNVKEITIMGRLATTQSGKPGPQVPFKVIHVAVISSKRQQ